MKQIIKLIFYSTVAILVLGCWDNWDIGDSKNDEKSPKKTSSELCLNYYLTEIFSTIDSDGDDNPNILEIKTYKYDQRGNKVYELVEKDSNFDDTLDYKHWYTYIFDDHSLKIQEEFQRDANNNGNIDSSYKTVFNYNKFGLLVLSDKRYYDHDGEIYNKEVCSFGYNGVLTSL